mmetsp:Transcript_77343/g.153565  ORF Transcript_77343/g.153565 Transcript_77343/m.153565 type:complete len:200 (+) Transcript_77343:1115-1714(+)
MPPPCLPRPRQRRRRRLAASGPRRVPLSRQLMSQVRAPLLQRTQAKARGRRASDARPLTPARPPDPSLPLAPSVPGAASMETARLRSARRWRPPTERASGALASDRVANELQTLPPRARSWHVGDGAWLSASPHVCLFPLNEGSWGAHRCTWPVHSRIRSSGPSYRTLAFLCSRRLAAPCALYVTYARAFHFVPVKIHG